MALLNTGAGLATSVSSTAFPLLAPDGSAAAPSYSFASDTDTGFLLRGPAVLDVSLGGTTKFEFITSGSEQHFRMAGDMSLAWTAGSGAVAASDLLLLRDAANTLAQRNGANAQSFNIYNTYTNSSNYKRLSIQANSSETYLTVNGLGTGAGGTTFIIGTDSNNAVDFQVAGIRRWRIADTTGHLLAFTDNTYDIGASGATRPRNIYVAGNVLAVGYVQTPTLFFPSHGYFQSSSDGVFVLQNLAASDFNRLQFGGTTSSFPAIKRSSAALQFRLADDSDYASITAKNISVDSANSFIWGGRSIAKSSADGFVEFWANNGTSPSVVQGSRFVLAEQAAPATPASGYGVAYPKTDGKLYWKDDAGTEYDLTASGTPGGSTTQIQYNNAGAFGGSADFVWNTATRTGRITSASGILDFRGHNLEFGTVAEAAIFNTSGSVKVEDTVFDGKVVKLVSGGSLRKSEGLNQEIIGFRNGANVTHANSLTETTLLTAVGATNGTKTYIPGTSTTINDKVVFRGMGFYSTDTITPGTGELKIKSGATTLITTGAITMPSGVTSDFFEFEVVMVARNIGVGTGAVNMVGALKLANGTAVVIHQLVDTAQIPFDFNTSHTFDITWDWGTADTDNTITAVNVDISF